MKLRIAEIFNFIQNWFLEEVFGYHGFFCETWVRVSITVYWSSLGDDSSKEMLDLRVVVLGWFCLFKGLNKGRSGDVFPFFASLLFGFLKNFVLGSTGGQIRRSVV